MSRNNYAELTVSLPAKAETLVNCKPAFVKVDRKSVTVSCCSAPPVLRCFLSPEDADVTSGLAGGADVAVTT